ncbi:uncharacterized protein ACO6RY_01869 [Pungitius sinensis]
MQLLRLSNEAVNRKRSRDARHAAVALGKPVGGDCDLVLANGRAAEAASDPDSANRDAAGPPLGNSWRVPRPRASPVFLPREARRDI